MEAFRRYRDIFRFFEVERATLHPALSGQSLVTALDDEVHVNVFRREDTGDILLSVVNMNGKRVCTSLRIPSLARLGLSARRSYLIYDPVQGIRVDMLSGSQLRELPVSLGAHGHCLLHLSQVRKEMPSVVFAVGADGLVSQEWRPRRKALEFSLRGPTGAEVEIAVFSPRRPRALACGEEAIRLSYRSAQMIAKATAPLDPDRPFRLSY